MFRSFVINGLATKAICLTAASASPNEDVYHPGRVTSVYEAERHNPEQY